MRTVFPLFELHLEHDDSTAHVENDARPLQRRSHLVPRERVPVNMKMVYFQGFQKLNIRVKQSEFNLKVFNQKNLNFELRTEFAYQ